MRKYVLMTSSTVIFSKITSVILELQKSEAYQIEDFLSILKLSEITKTAKNGSKWANKRKFKIFVCVMFEILFILGIYLVINNSFNQHPNNYHIFV